MIGYFRQEFFIVFKFWLVGVVLSIIVSCLRAIFCGLLTMLEDRTEIGRDLMNRGERLSVFSLSHSFLTCSCSDFKQSTAYWTDQLFVSQQHSCTTAMCSRLAFLQSKSYQMVRFCTGPKGSESKERIRTKVVRPRKYYAEPTDSSVFYHISAISCHNIYILR